MSSVLVLDANIIVRAVLGEKVRNCLLMHSELVDFFTPDVCINDAEKYLPGIFEKRSIPFSIAMDVFEHIKKILQVIDKSIYEERISEAQQRMKTRDLDDWPVAATALLFNCPIWTEDKDFFGVDIPVWTTDRIHLFFNLLKDRLAMQHSDSHKEQGILLS